MGIVRHSHSHCLTEDGGSRWKFHPLELFTPVRVALATCCHTTTHSSLCDLGALSEPSAPDLSGCDAGFGRHVGPGTSSSCGLAEAHVQLPRLGVGHLPLVSLWVPHTVRVG